MNAAENLRGRGEPTSEPSADDKHEKLRKILDDFRVAMTVTVGNDGALIARPMSIARMDDDGTMYFATSVGTEKVHEVVEDSRMAVTVQSKGAYAAVNGKATVSRDRKLIEALWSDAWKPFFPGGPSDPDIVIVTFRPESGEYWDQGGMKKISYLFRALTAAVKRERIDFDKEDHGRVKM